MTALNKHLYNKPFLIEAPEAHKKKLVTYLRNGVAHVLTRKGVKRVPRTNQYDLTQATVFGLNERLTMAATSPRMNKQGSTLRDLFNTEWERYTHMLERASGEGDFNYGVYAYYLQQNSLVRYCPAFWHRTVSVASSSKLITDPMGKLSWKEIQDVFHQTTVSVAGGSVGSSILHATVMDMRPANVKIADKSLYKMENINRVRLRYDDIVEPNTHRGSLVETLLRNKAEVIADQLYAMDPFMNVFVYKEGITHETLVPFFDGESGEPPADIVIEEVDDPRIKILIREEARNRRIPLVMVTDVGSSVQLDILRYDQRKNLPLSYGITDNALKTAMQAVYDRPADRTAFFGFVDALIGREYRRDELGKIIEQKSEIPTSTIIPQLGSTAAMGGAIVAETIARMLLGHEYPSRIFINKRSFEVSVYQ